MYPHKIIVDNIPLNANILDIGCGSGAILSNKMLSKINSYTGIDPKIKTQILKDKIKIYNKSLEDMLTEINNYNCIIMIDVMHHIKKSEQEFLFKKIIESMKIDTTFIYKDISSRNFFYSFMNKIHDLLYNFQLIEYLSSDKVKNILNYYNKYSYKHFYKRILWFDHEFFIIRKKN